MIESFSSKMLKSRYFNCWTTVVIFEHLLTQIVSELAKEDETLFIQKNVKCPGGMLLSSTICLPNGYRKGELPTVPVEINTAIEVNNIREIDDKKMTVSLEFHPQLVWADNRISTNFTEEEKRSGKVLNNVNLENIWKPDLLMYNRYSIDTVNCIMSLLDNAPN